MPNFEIIGFLAALLTTSSFVPQVYKTWRTKNVEGMSLAMFISFFIGIFLWLIYGFFIGSLSMILANVITCLLTLYLIFMIVKYK